MRSVVLASAIRLLISHIDSQEEVTYKSRLRHSLNLFADKNQTMTAVKFAAESATLYHNMHKLQTLHNIRTGQQVSFTYAILRITTTSFSIQ